MEIFYKRQENKRKDEPPSARITENDRNIFDAKCDSVVESIDKGYKIMILLRGLPGSGKTYLATNLLERTFGNVNFDEFIFNTDSYYDKSKTDNLEALQEAHANNQRKTFSKVNKGFSPIIIDSDNLEIWEMKIYCVMGVKFGYIIEILDVATDWALDPKELSRRNVHDVDEKKIDSMLKRYERNVTPQQLLVQFELVYTVDMPQYRDYPPLMVPFKTAKLPVDAANGVRRKELPVEYVHDFRKNRKSKDKAKTGNEQIVDIENKVGDKNLELKPLAKKKDLVQPTRFNFAQNQLDDSKIRDQKIKELRSSIANNAPTSKPQETSGFTKENFISEREHKERLDRLYAFLENDEEKDDIQLPPPIDDPQAASMKMEGTISICHTICIIISLRFSSNP